jgi:hypothetical protein
MTSIIDAYVSDRTALASERWICGATVNAQSNDHAIAGVEVRGSFRRARQADGLPLKDNPLFRFHDV